MSKWNDQLAIFDRLVEACPDFERKGKKMIYTSANGYMFSLLNKEAEIGIRLSKESQKAFIAEHPGSGPYKSHGATMKDYVLVPEDLLKDEARVVEYMKESHAFVMTLPPK